LGFQYLQGEILAADVAVGIEPILAMANESATAGVVRSDGVASVAV
jgi:hypothetical protein